MIVTIDGPAGSGKSTVAKMVGSRSRLVYLNSGNIYRAITSGLLKELGVDEVRGSIPDRAQSLVNTASEFHIQVSGGTDDASPAQQGDILFNGTLLGDEELRSDLVDSLVAQVSSIPEIRELVNTILRKEALDKDVVVEGRDMSTIVFPRAELQFYLDASIQARAKRRLDQGTSSLSYEELVDTIARRDRIDKEKDVGALKLSPQARYLDTSDLTIEQVCEIVLRSIREHK
ncbi:(d)CMP kinase [Salinispira pacifica]|uniref:Cytidylate kinase n=1 Tax=Salinispira pacifica TaxID=1307761 RepID=V5WHZ3_9SPIO|nr:(d)CMP kinase [Salinispira pacifica]AHC15164.1 Cytidylate kinase [Salinispira pacifica]